MDWKRFKSDDEWVTVPMSYQNEKLIGELPHQQPAGKLLYRVHLKKDETTVTITDGEGIVIRFKGDVPLFVLVPHILAMFVGMLLSTRAGLEIFNGNQNLKKLVYWTIGFLVVGGFVFGPFVQKYAFNAFWTGWPFGPDLTDNKTAFAVFSWIVAGLMIKWSPKPQRWALAAAIITLAVYLIPHSLLGSELDYQKEGQQKVAQMLEVDHRPTL